MKKRKGSVMDIMSIFIMIIAITVITMAYMNSLQLISQKQEISQLTRKYILRMETVGYLTYADRITLLNSLTNIGASNVYFTGTTTSKVKYGEEITLSVTGKIKGKEKSGGLIDAIFQTQSYNFKEVRISTAKH